MTIGHLDHLRPYESLSHMKTLWLRSFAVLFVGSQRGISSGGPIEMRLLR